MSKFRLNRRAILRGAGTIAIALPWLEIMGRPRRARAAGPALAQRFVAVFKPGGTVLDQWRPTGTETAFTLSPILQPLAPVKDKLIVLDGLDMKSAIGEQQQSGLVALLTGTAQASNIGFATGPSIDQVLASGVLKDQPQPGGGHIVFNHPKASLELAVRWGTGKAHGRVTPFDILSFANDGTFSPIPPALDPVQIWQGLFGALPGPTVAAAGRWRKSMLDFVDQRYVKLAGRLGAADKQKLDQHLTSLRALEMQVRYGLCTAPPLVDTSDYNPKSGLMSADDGSVVDLKTDAAIPKVGKLMMDMLVMALACDITSVASLMWSDTEAKFTFPWLGLSQTYYYYQNGGGYQPVQCQIIDTWYQTQHAYLLQQMANVDMGGHSLLDESVVFFGSEMQNGSNHVKTSMPFLLAGGGGGLRGGRLLTYDHRSHNDLLVSILNLFGDTRTTFGTPLYCAGPLTNLLT